MPFKLFQICKKKLLENNNKKITAPKLRKKFQFLDPSEWEESEAMQKYRANWTY